MVTVDGIEIPDKIIIGMEPDSWVIQMLYNDETGAAKWVSGAPKRRLYRMQLTLLEELVYIAPVPASLEAKQTKIF